MLEKIAKSAVKDCLHIGKNDAVLINTWQHTIDLANAVALECSKIGAETFTRLSTDDVFYGSMLLGPIESLKKPEKTLLTLWDSITADIDLSGPEDPSRMRKVPAERWAAMSQGQKPMADKTLAEKKRSLFIALGYVTPQRAKTYGFDFKKWQKSMMEASAVSYPALSKLGKKAKDRLEKAKEVQIVSKGTKLSFQLEERPAFLFDGVVDEDDMKMGSYDANLPAGSISITPREDSANGAVLFDQLLPIMGMLVKDLKWTFKDGKVTKFQGSKNVKTMRDWWEKAKGDKDKIGSLTIGINPKAKYGFLNNAIVQGATTISIGENRYVGGKNNSDYGAEGTLSKATIKLDKKTFISRGKLVP